MDNYVHIVGNQSMTYLLQPEPWVLDGIKHERYKGMYVFS